MKFQMSPTHGKLKYSVRKFSVHFYKGNINKTRKNLIHFILRSHISHLLSPSRHFMLLISSNALRHSFFPSLELKTALKHH